MSAAPASIAEMRAAVNVAVQEERKTYAPPAVPANAPTANLGPAILDASAFCALNLPEKRMVICPWISEQAIVLLTGWRGTGKTWFVLLLLDAITRGQAFGPWKCETSVPCLYLDGEMAAQDIIERLQGIGGDPAGRLSPLYIYSDAYASVLGLPKASLRDEEWRDAMKAQLLKNGVKLWVVDNIASLTSGLDENSKQEWDVVNQWLLELRFAGISTILLHHVGKGGDQRGTSGREDNIDISISLQKPQNYRAEEGARFIVRFGKHRIRHKDLPLIQDVEFQIAADQAGRVTYTWGNAQRNAKTEILRMLDDGVSQSEIAATLGISKAHVSQTRSGAMRDGLLGQNGKLTQAGFAMVFTE